MRAFAVHEAQPDHAVVLIAQADQVGRLATPVIIEDQIVAVPETLEGFGWGLLLFRSPQRTRHTVGPDFELPPGIHVSASGYAAHFRVAAGEI